MERILQKGMVTMKNIIAGLAVMFIALVMVVWTNTFVETIVYGVFVYATILYEVLYIHLSGWLYA